MQCPRCQHQNRTEALFCSRCGLPLNETAQAFDPADELVTRSLDNHEHETKALEDGSDPRSVELSLRIEDRIVMMPFPAGAEMMLGREALSRTSHQADVSRSLYPFKKGLPLQLDEPLVFFDLTDYGAVEAGISRRHALIRHEGDHLTVEDMGSSNGTYVNRHHVQPGTRRILQNGDFLVLSKMIITVAFRRPATTEFQTSQD